MAVKVARFRAALMMLGLVLTMEPATALHRRPNHRQADGIVHSRAAASQPTVHYGKTPSSNDAAALASSPSALSPAETSSATAPVHVQPRRNDLIPNSDEENAVQKRITDFNEMQRLQEKIFDKKLLICRGC